jgi:membrane protein implicated in regulation of membrane protease activity
LFGLRKPLKALIKRDKSLEYSEYVGDKDTVVKAIPLQGEGRIFYRGTEWIAIAKDGQEIHKGTQVIIKELDGIKLIVGE